MLQEVGALSLDFLNDELLLELRHLSHDLLLGGHLALEPRVVPDVLNRGPVIEVVRHHAKDQVLKIVRIVLARV